MLREFSEPRLHEDNEPNEPRLDPDETERVLSDKLKEQSTHFLIFSLSCILLPFSLMFIKVLSEANIDNES